MEINFYGVFVTEGVMVRVGVRVGVEVGLGVGVGGGVTTGKPERSPWIVTYWVNNQQVCPGVLGFSTTI